MWNGRLEEGSETFRSLVSSAARVPAIGEDFYVVPNKGTDKFYASLLKNGVTNDRIFTTIASGYAAVTSGSGDTLFVCPGAYTQTSSLTWAKHYTNLIGLSAPIPTNQRSRIQSTTAALSPLITWSANGCVLSNILFSQDGSNATTCAVNMLMSGNRNRIEYCTFRNLGADAVTGTATRNLKITSSDGENYYKYCTIGADSLDYTSGTVVTIEYAGTNTARDTYEGCNILSGGGAAGLFLLTNANSTTAWTKFLDCYFFNNDLGAGDQLTQGFSITGGGNGVFLLAGKTQVYGAATLETDNTGNLLGESIPAAATGQIPVALTF
jgi:hypothetical protein